MQKRNLRTVWCTFTFVSLGILVAIQIILTRLLAVNIGGFGRITFGPVALIMAGLWFGPVLTGALSSLLFNTMGLVLILGYNFYAIMPTRLVQFAAMIPMYIIVTILLYYSPATDMVRQSLRSKTAA